MKTKTIIIVLAAGSSSRLQRPKQLLEWKGTLLLNMVLREAALSNLGEIVLVLGASSEIIKEKITDARVNIIYNENWAEGMATSIKAGLKAALKLNEEVEGVIFLVCDQPFISAALLNSLEEKHQLSGMPIVASEYGETLGTPAYFHRSIFPDLLLLSGDTGAKKLIQKHRKMVAVVPFFKGEIDIDTNEDFQNLKEN